MCAGTCGCMQGWRYHSWRRYRREVLVAACFVANPLGELWIDLRRRGVVHKRSRGGVHRPALLSG